ncbi:DUF6114 domain-containing protein [Actinoplanes sp. NPDC049118]|uniref:DUF6114 domain-containing protein n=1 Tax=Actinoplanes sp. NPDC049118 TaxID=3155769 RepID=UPI0033CEA929
MATASTWWSTFRRWRRARPFWGGLLLLIAGLELFLSANLTLGDLQVHFGPEGFLSYLLPLLLILCGVLTWVTPGQRLFYGVLGLLTAVYSLIGLNLGGFFAGMLTGIIGGALVLAWAPRRPRTQTQTTPAPTEPREPPVTQVPGEPLERRDPGTTMIVPGFNAEPEGQHRAVPRPRTRRYPEPDPPQPPPDGFHRRALAITLVPLTLTAAVLIAGSRTPARAEPDCPEGLPSRPAAAAKKESTRPSPAKTAEKKNSPEKKESPEKESPEKESPKPSAATGTSAPASPAPAETDDNTGNPIVDGWNGFVDGIGDLFGVGDEDEASPAPSPSAGPSGSPPAGDPSEPATSPSGTPGGPGSPAPGSAPGSAAPSPTPSLPDVPCLGPRVFKQAGPDDVPVISLKGGTLETASLTMYDSTYDGVTQLSTAEGTVAALKFSMTKAVNKPFRLTVPEAGGRTTQIDSKELSTEGNVRFYTPSFKGKLFGVIPVTFTPESPPPLTLPVLWFTDVEIKLAFVRCDRLKGRPLVLREKA